LDELVLGGKGEKGIEIVLIDRLRLAAARIAREELESVGTDRQRVAAHGQEAFGGGEMAADVQHECSNIVRWPG